MFYITLGYIFKNLFSSKIVSITPLFFKTSFLCQKPSPEIIFLTNFGRENQLVVIFGGHVNFEERMTQGLNLQIFVSLKEWDEFFDMLYGSIYPNMVKKIMGECICSRAKSREDNFSLSIWCPYHHHPNYYCKCNKLWGWQCYSRYNVLRTLFFLLALFLMIYLTYLKLLILNLWH